MKKIALLLTILITASCVQQEKEATKQPSPLDNIQGPEVKAVLDRAITYAGGWDNWANLNSIKYRKHSVLILEGGEIESDVDQVHTYEMRPEFKANIAWSVDSTQHLIEYSPQSAVKYIDGTDTDSAPEKVSETVMSAIYVLGMPFKLLDGGARLSYQGETLFKDSVAADIIHARYDPVENENHSTSDLWWFYFEKETGHFLGSKVFHTPTYALIENLSFTKDIPLKFPVHRKSYRTDSLGNIKFLRAEFWYSEFEID